MAPLGIVTHYEDQPEKSEKQQAEARKQLQTSGQQQAEMQRQLDASKHQQEQYQHQIESYGRTADQYRQQMKDSAVLQAKHAELLERQSGQLDYAQRLLERYDALLTRLEGKLPEA